MNAQIDTISYKLQKSMNPGQALTNLFTDTKKLQHHLSEKLVRAQVLHTIENSSSKDAASLMSLQKKGSGSWLDCIPSSQKLALSLDLFRLVALVRLAWSSNAIAYYN